MLSDACKSLMMTRPKPAFGRQGLGWNPWVGFSHVTNGGLQLTCLIQKSHITNRRPKLTCLDLKKTTRYLGGPQLTF